MITREKLSRGEGEIVEGDPDIGSRKRTSQSEKMASEEGLSQNEREFQRTFFSMSEMVKVLYDDYLEQRDWFKGNLQSKTKVKKERTLLNLLLHLLHLHILLLLQVQVQTYFCKKTFILINISLTCHYLNLM
jgi:hypothetical protein